MLFKHFYGFAMGVALWYSNSREGACEIVNDGLMKAFDRMHQHRQGQSANGWFRRNLCSTFIEYYGVNTRYPSIGTIQNKPLGA